MDDVAGARARNEDALGDFPFEDDASRANAFALFNHPGDPSRDLGIFRWRWSMHRKPGDLPKIRAEREKGR